MVTELEKARLHSEYRYDEHLSTPRRRKLYKSMLSELKHQFKTWPLYTDKLDVCSICLDKIEHKINFEILPCKHSFHKICITKWRNKKSVCPLCKTCMCGRDHSKPTIINGSEMADLIRYLFDIPLPTVN